MGLTPETESKLGSDCSGVDGASNRVLTLANTKTTVDGGLLVYVEGLVLALTTNFTIDHNNTGSEITFLGAINDSDVIVVNYYQVNLSGVGTDFENGPLVDFGVIAVRTPVTVTTGFNGQKTYADGTPENIDIVWDPYIEKHNLDKAGLTKVYDARVFIKPDATLNKYDKITYESKVYRVEEVSIRNFNGVASFQVGGLFYIKDA